MERQPKEAAGSTSPSRRKIFKKIFVTDHLYMSGALVGLVGELFVFFLFFFLSFFFLVGVELNTTINQSRKKVSSTTSANRQSSPNFLRFQHGREMVSAYFRNNIV